MPSRREYAERAPPRNNLAGPCLPEPAGAAMVGRMFRKGPLVALSALALSMAACGLDPRKEAAKDIAAFMAAVQRDDQPAIEAALDRPALRINLRDQLADLGRAAGIDVGNGPSEFAMDRMITTQAIRLAEARSGLPAIPTAAQVEPVLKMPDKAHACVQDTAKDHCALTFARRGGIWRLAGMLATEPHHP